MSDIQVAHTWPEAQLDILMNIVGMMRLRQQFDTDLIIVSLYPILYFVAI